MAEAARVRKAEARKREEELAQAARINEENLKR